MFNSVDDPVFPTAGKVLVASLSASERTSDEVRSFLVPRDRIVFDSRQRFYSANVSAKKVWPLTHRSSLSGGLGAGFNHAELIEGVDSTGGFLRDRDTFSASLELGQAVDLIRSVPGGPFHELRWESSVEAHWRDSSLRSEFRESSGLGYSLSTGLKYRSSWGVFQLRLVYADFTEL